MYATSPPMCKNRRKNEPVRFAYIRLLTDNSCMQIVPPCKKQAKNEPVRFACFPLYACPMLPHNISIPDLRLYKPNTG